MNVRELIRALADFDPDREVVVSHAKELKQNSHAVLPCVAVTYDDNGPGKVRAMLVVDDE